MRNFNSLVTVLIAFVLCSCSGLLYNAKTGNIEGMEESLTSGTSIETRNEAGSTALIVAAYNRQAKAVEYLCKKGADVNAQDNYSRTALIHAAYYNIYDVAEILVKYGADKKIKDRYGNTALDYAKEYKYTRMITLLETVSPTMAPVSGLAEGSAQKITDNVNPEEPWTGVWVVEGSLTYSGRWRMIQTGKIVESTKESVCDIQGKVRGNKLTGKIFTASGGPRYTTVMNITISSDGLSFEGSLDLPWNNKHELIKGKKE